MRALACVALIVASVGCCVGHPVAPAPGPYLFHGDPAFTPEERDQIDQAARSWGRWSKGRTLIRVVYDLQGTPEFRILRGTPEDVADADVPKGKTAIATTKGHRVILVPSLLRGLWWETSAHEFGHAIGILDHTKDPHSIMSAVVSYSAGWTAEDENACRAVRACP